MCTTSYLPLAVDDPKSRDVVSDLAAAVFNEPKEATVGRGEKALRSMVVISANFTAHGHQEEK